jgi:basic membrane protein A
LLLAASSLEACLPTPAPEVECIDPHIFCVGLVTDVGGVKDDPLAQSAWLDMQRARDEEIATHIAVIETMDEKDYDENIAVFAAANYDLIITSGYDQSAATLASSEAYPDLMFLGLDQDRSATGESEDEALPVQPEEPGAYDNSGMYEEPTLEELPLEYEEIPTGEEPGLVGEQTPTPGGTTGGLVMMTFPEDQSGYLAGALAAMVSKTGKIGAVCDLQTIAVVWRYCEGFRAGAAYTDATVQVQVMYRETGSRELIFNDPDWGRDTAFSLIRQGADVIFGMGGATGEAAVQIAAQQGVFAIGSETDWYLTMNEARPFLLTSAIKQPSPAVFEIIQKAVDGEFPTQDSVGYPALASYHDLDGLVTEKMREWLDEVYKDLQDGSLQTGVPATPPF